MSVCMAARLKADNVDDVPCTASELENIITFPAGGMTMLPNTDYDQVHPHILIGDEDTARNLPLLRQLKVTHVLNAAHGKNQFQVNTNHVMYLKAKMKFLGIDAMDIQNFKIEPFFKEAAAFIQDAVKSRGLVMVHCRQGVSRSATLVIAYLMLEEHMTAQDAVRMVRDKRNISPNGGFLEQLSTLNEDLKRTGHFKTSVKNAAEEDLKDDTLDSEKV